MGFFYSFTETLIHSLWQAGFLALVYGAASPLMRRQHPLQKRDLLYGLLVAQFLISLITFYIYFTGSSFTGSAVFSAAADLLGDSGNYAAPVFYVYLATVCFRSGRTAVRWKRFRSLYKKELLRPSAELKVFTALKAYHLGIKRKVSLWYSNHTRVPLTFGFFKPVILLPFSLINNISTAETEAIILHELAHIKSRDYLLNWLLVSMETLYFYNPFINLLAKNIRLEREKNCDVQVVNFSYPQWLYAQALLKIARNKTSLNVLHLGAVKKTPELIKRIQFFSEKNNLEFRKSRTGFAAVFLYPLFIAAAVCFLSPGNNSSVSTEVNTLAIASSEVLQPIRVEGLSANETIDRAVASAKILPVTHPEPALLPEKEIADPTYIAETNNFALPAAFSETDSAKEFIYDVETPQGKVTQSFRLTNVKGQWVLQPQWMVIETRPDKTFRTLQQLNLIDSIQ